MHPPFPDPASFSQPFPQGVGQNQQPHYPIAGPMEQMFEAIRSLAEQVRVQGEQMRQQGEQVAAVAQALAQRGDGSPERGMLEPVDSVAMEAEQRGLLMARLRPLDERRGHRLRRCNWRGYVYEQGRWYLVDQNDAPYMAAILQDHNDPGSPSAFEIVTPQDARRAEMIERNQARAGDYLNPMRPSSSGGQITGPVRVAPGPAANSRNAGRSTVAVREG